MGYIATLSSKQKANVDLLIETMDKMGLKNEFTQAGILSIISKESGFDPSPEKSYRNTSVSRIRQIFGSLVSGKSDSELEAIKKDDRLFFNLIYGKRYGNDGYSTSWSGYKESWALPFKDGNDGWRYRGAGFNQLTFKGNFKSVGDAVGIDLVSHPEFLQEPVKASEVAVKYFLSKFKSGYSPKHQDQYNSPDIDSFKSIQDSTLALYHANAGFGKPMFTVNTATSTGGLKKALDRAPEFLLYVRGTKEKKNSGLN